MKNRLPLFGCCMMIVTGLTSFAAEKSASGSFVTVRAEAQELTRVGEEDFRGVSADHRAVSYKIKPKKGWKLQQPKNGKLDLSTGELSSYSVTGLMGEDGGTGTVHTCDSVTTVVTNHIVPVLSVAASGAADRILVPPEVTTAQLAIAGNVTVISNGVHAVITTITPCSVCGLPHASMTTNTVAIVPSNYCWAWSVAGTNGNAVGTSLSASACVTNPAYHALSVTATATNLPACCGCSAQAATNALVMQLDSETIVVLDNNLRRRTLGVGEYFKVLLLPAGVKGNWTFQVGENGQPVQSEVLPSNPQEAPHKKASRSFTFKHEDGLFATLPFSVLEPSGVVLNTPTGLLYATGCAGAGMQFAVFLKPLHVSFYRVQWREVATVSTDAQGYFSETNVWPAANLDHGKCGADGKWRGTSNNNYIGTDTPDSGFCHQPWQSGSFSWSIPALWRIPDDSDLSTENNLPWSNQYFSITSNGTVTVKKFDYSAIREITDTYSNVSNVP